MSAVAQRGYLRNVSSVTHLNPLVAMLILLKFGQLRPLNTAELRIEVLKLWADYTPHSTVGQPYPPCVEPWRFTQVVTCRR
jgi:hypothetical protein